MTPPIKLNKHATAVPKEASIYWDKHDPYGSLMSLWFPLATYCDVIRGETLPRYNSGMGGRDENDRDYDHLWEHLSDHQLREVHRGFSKLHAHYEATDQTY